VILFFAEDVTVVAGAGKLNIMNANNEWTYSSCPKWLETMVALIYGWSTLVPRRYSMVGQADIVIIGGWVCAIAVIASVLRGRVRLRRVSWRISMLVIISTVLPLTSVMRVLLGSITGFQELWRTFYFAVVLMVLGLLGVCNFSRSTYIRFLRTQCLVSGLSLLLGIIMALNPSSFGSVSSALRLLSGGGGTFRAHSPFGGPNILGTLGAVVTPIMAGLAEKQARPAVFAFGLVATALTGSKTAFLSLLAGLVFQWMLTFRRNPIRLIAGTVFVAILVSLCVLYVPRLSHLLSGSFGLESGGSSRLTTWKQAVHLISEKPIIGWGKDYFLFESSELGVPFLAHNLWLELILDFGVLVGLPLAFILVVCLYRMVYLSMKNLKMLGPFAAATVAFVFTTMGDYIYWEPRCIVVFVLLLSSLSGLIRSTNEETILNQSAGY